MKLNEPKFWKLEASVYRADKSIDEVKTITASAHKLDILKKEDIKENANFLYLQADLCNVGLINKNGHGMTVEDAVKVYKKWEHTFVDVEHETEDVRGFIVKSALTDKDSKQILTEEEALASTKPINISIGFLVWTNIDPSLTTLLQKISAAEGEANELISLSLELSFKDFIIYKGSSKNMFEGQIISADEEVEAIFENLKDFGGTGVDKDGTPVYLVCSGDGLNPIGCGLVTSPAADVTGISSQIKGSDDSNDEEDECPEDCDCEDCQEDKMKARTLEALESMKKANEELTNKVNKLTASLDKFSGSQLNNSDVKVRSMKINNTSDITDENLKEIKACELTSFISEELAKKSGEHQAALDAKANELNDAIEASRIANEQLSSVNANLENLTKELDELKTARAAEALEAAFNDRMSALDEEFELDDAARGVIASQIKDLSEESFVSWKSGFDVLAADKNKAKKDAEKEMNKDKEGNKEKFVKASDENTDVDPLEVLKAKLSAVPSSTEFSKDVIAQYKDAFSLEKGFTVEI